jgi:hypothetical protein
MLMALGVRFRPLKSHKRTPRELTRRNRLSFRFSIKRIADEVMAANLLETH